MKRLLMVCLLIGKAYASEIQNLDMNDHSVIDKASYFAVYARSSAGAFARGISNMRDAGENYTYKIPEYEKYKHLINAQNSDKDLLVFFSRDNKQIALFLIDALRNRYGHLESDSSIVFLAASKLDDRYKRQAIKVKFGICIKNGNLIASFYDESQKLIATKRFVDRQTNYLSRESIAILSNHIDLSRLTYVTDNSLGTFLWPKTVYKMVRGLNARGDLEFYEIQS